MIGVSKGLPDYCNGCYDINWPFMIPYPINYPSKRCVTVRHKLEIYVADDCPTCTETVNLANIIVSRYTNLDVDLINLNNPDTICPDNVFAVPTFIYNERIIFLGNPSLQELDAYFREMGDL